MSSPAEEMPMDLLSDDTLRQLMGECVDYGGANVYVESMKYHFRNLPQRQNCIDLAGIVSLAAEPEDEEARAAAAAAFYSGTLIGLRTIEIESNVDTLAGLFDTPITVDPPVETPEDIDPVVRFKRMAGAILQLGNTAFAESKDFRLVVSSWQDDICHDIESIDYLKSGFGLIVHLFAKSNRIRDALALEVLCDTIESGTFDLDAAWQQFDKGDA